MARTVDPSACNFDFGMTTNDFQMIVNAVAKGIDRIAMVSVNGPMVRATVRSITEKTCWDFQLNFNDKGFLTGEYKIISDNDQSDIPHTFAERIKQAIISFPDTPITENYIPMSNKESGYHKLLMSYIKSNKEIDRQAQKAKSYKDKYVKTAITIPIIIAILLIAFAGIFQASKKIKPEIAVNFGSSDVTNVMLVDIVNMFSDTGFTNIQLKPAKELSSDKQFDEGKVKSITINGNKIFKKGDKFKSDAKIIITYYSLKEIEIPFSSDDLFGMSKEEARESLQNAGFFNITFFPLPYQWIFPDNSVINVQFDSSNNLEKGLFVRPDVPIVIFFNSKSGIE